MSVKLKSPSVQRTSRTPWRSKRFTRTPITRSLGSVSYTGVSTRSRSVRNRRSSIERTPEEKSFNGLVLKTWHVYRLSPLYKFSHETSALRNYSRMLSGHLEAEYNVGMAVITENEKANMAVFSIVRGLQKSGREPEAIQIELKQKPIRGDAEARTVYTAILCCVGASDDVLEKVKQPFVLLPLMLSKGPVMLNRYLTSWLECQFDCSVHAAHFSPLSLSWMVAIWVGSEAESTKPVMLKYKVPSEVEGLDHITLNINSKDCKVLWDCIHSTEDKTCHKKEVVTFVQALEAHFYHHFQINISAMPLCMIGTPIAVAESDGKIKIFTPEHVHQILGLVTEVILETSIEL
ncbi:hypothetical protein LSH36_988g00027 [Paralvinella palmiformis]|uniref:Centromere protein L n=1 Tax=Paralvinella palmiformis TaxID=53620 RepID=A0AAD9IY16_9ANNE|nr:hypothetical protein LSH36_988g00027 [Paralvinella palmiformis]